MADSERSAEEREAARREREAARRAQSGVFHQQEADPALVADQPQPDAGDAPLVDWSEDEDDDAHVHEAGHRGRPGRGERGGPVGHPPDQPHGPAQHPAAQGAHRAPPPTATAVGAGAGGAVSPHSSRSSWPGR